MSKEDIELVSKRSELARLNKEIEAKMTSLRNEKSKIRNEIDMLKREARFCKTCGDKSKGEECNGATCAAVECLYGEDNIRSLTHATKQIGVLYRVIAATHKLVDEVLVYYDSPASSVSPRRIQAIKDRIEDVGIYEYVTAAKTPLHSLRDDQDFMYADYHVPL